MSQRSTSESRRQNGNSGCPVAWLAVPNVTLAVDMARFRAAVIDTRENRSEFRKRRDGRVVDGGGLENLIGVSSRSAILTEKFAFTAK